MTKVSLITRVSSHETPIIYFLSIKRHQPPTTLFPYTTLFRSREIVCVEQLSEALHSRGTCESNAVDAAAGEERVELSQRLIILTDRAIGGDNIDARSRVC